MKKSNWFERLKLNTEANNLNMSTVHFRIYWFIGDYFKKLSESFKWKMTRKNKSYSMHNHFRFNKNVLIFTTTSEFRKQKVTSSWQYYGSCRKKRKLYELLSLLWIILICYFWILGRVLCFAAASKSSRSRMIVHRIRKVLS